VIVVAEQSPDNSMALFTHTPAQNPYTYQSSTFRELSYAVAGMNFTATPNGPNTGSA
jgi:hypothetical protein